MSNTEGAQSAGLQALQEILEEALTRGADSVELEYEDERLEVCWMFGNTGMGTLLTDQEVYSGIIDAIVERARLERRPRGKMRIDLHGKPHTVMVEIYESFGESCFRLILDWPA